MDTVRQLFRWKMPPGIADSRSLVVFKNILLSFFFKGFNIIIQLALVPLTIGYLNNEQYGVWLTLSAIVGWFSFFDIGLGNGLRNKLAEALVERDFLLARTYISTSYAILSIIFGTIPFVFWLINPYLDWDKYLNAPEILDGELGKVALVTFIFFCLRFIFGIVSSILFAVQRAAMNTLITTFGNLLSILFIYCLRFIIPGSLFWVAFIFSAIPVAVFIGASIYFFLVDFRELRPSFSLVNFRYSKQLFGLGFRFFIIQIAGIVLFSSTNVVITQLFGPSEVTAYNIAFRYFSLLTMVYGIVLTPLWSAFTEAYAKGDLDWVRKTVKKLSIVSFLFCIVGIIMIFLSDYFYRLWVGENIEVAKSTTILLGTFVMVSLIAAPYNTFINGIGKIKLQFTSALFSIFATIPLAIFFGDYLELGTAGVVMAMLCTSVPCTILYFLQFKMVINKTSKGIWDK